MIDPKKSLFDEDGNPRPALTTTLDNVLRMQRPLALSIVKKLREAHPDETPAQIHKRLDRAYLRDITAMNWQRNDRWSSGKSSPSRLCSDACLYAAYTSW